MWKEGPNSWSINNLFGDYKELSAKVSVGAVFAYNVLGRVMSGVLRLAVVEHSATGECLFRRTFARRVIKRLTKETFNI